MESSTCCRRVKGGVVEEWVRCVGRRKVRLLKGKRVGMEAVCMCVEGMDVIWELDIWY